MADFALLLVNRLKEKGFRAVQPWQERTSVRVSENGKSYRVNISGSSVSAVFQIDDYIIKDGFKCDKLLLVSDQPVPNGDRGMAVFLELKGKDMEHAIEQLEATVKNKLFKPYPSAQDKTRARIVTAGCGPKSSSKIKVEEARVRFKQQYNIELRILKNNQPDLPINL